MNIRQNISLRDFNTFGINVDAAYYVEVSQLSEVAEIGMLPQRKYILGGGSNILLTQSVEGIVVHNKLKGIATEREDDTHVWLRVSAGEVWHDLVMYVVENGLGGIENLALIPGTVGASPIQNIGAYGVEVKETIDCVSYWDWDEKTLVSLDNSACAFGYRDSIFKMVLKDQVFVTSVVYKLNKNPIFNTTYGAIEIELENMGVHDLSVKAIAYAVMNIRRSKLPDPAKTGNAGSFFKNPTLDAKHFERLVSRYPALPSYPAPNEQVKIPAGWLIEHCGYKGYRDGDVGVHAKQALVLVNYGHAKGKDIWKLSGEIIQSVQERFGIELEREVQVW